MSTFNNFTDEDFIRFLRDGGLGDSLSRFCREFVCEKPTTKFHIHDACIRPKDGFIGAWDVEGKYIVEFDMPGCVKDDIKITVEGDMLCVEANRVLKPVYAENALYTSTSNDTLTYKYGVEFDKPDYSNVTASYENGVLHIEVQKLCEQKPAVKTIEVK